MHKKFEVNWTNIKEGCQSYTKAAPQQSWSDLSLDQICSKIIGLNSEEKKSVIPSLLFGSTVHCTYGEGPSIISHASIRSTSSL